MNQPTFIILGATGDLTKRKLLPAIYHLLENGDLQNFFIIGAARRPVTAASLLSEVKKFIPQIRSEIWAQIEKRTSYVPLRFTEKKDYAVLKSNIESIEQKHHLPGQRLFHLATLPDHFSDITLGLLDSGLSEEQKSGWTRVVYEKPFGHDLASAKAINQCVSTVFPEERVYRIDHYLGKELVGNIALVRFTNRILEPLWNNQHLEQVQIILNENFGVEERGKFYDTQGALHDVVQNHLLQMLALVGMESPFTLTGDYIRNEKVKVLEKVKVRDLLLGQYHGYQQEKDVNPASSTETFAALRLEIDNQRWRGIPFFLKTGKMLATKETSIHLKFKKVECLLPSCPSDSNYLTIQVQPKEGLSLEFNAKTPRHNFEVTPTRMNFGHHSLCDSTAPEAYETLLRDVLHGEQSLFVRNDEIEEAWKIMAQLKRGTLYQYGLHSNGPAELEQWSKEHGVRWRV